MQNNDFGFTFEDSEEVKTKILNEARPQDINSIRNHYTYSLTALVNMFLPLLQNLQKSPDKDTIRWPNRASAINNFIKTLEDKENTLIKEFDSKFGG